MIGSLFGPAAVGKDTVLNELTKNSNYYRMVNNTTRQPRSGEQEGIDYHFIDHSEHNRLISNGAYLTSNFAHGRYYGVELMEVKKAWHDNQIPVGHFGISDHLQLWRIQEEGDIEVRSVALLTKDFHSWEQRMRLRIAHKFIDETELYSRASSAYSELVFVGQNIGRFALVQSEVLAPTVLAVDCYYQSGESTSVQPSLVDNLIEDFDYFIKHSRCDNNE